MQQGSLRGVHLKCAQISSHSILLRETHDAPHNGWDRQDGTTSMIRQTIVSCTREKK